MRNRIYSLPIIFAVASVSTTFIILVATARFRSHSLPLFAVGAGVFITAVIDWVNIGKFKVMASIILSLFLGIMTLWSENHINRAPANLMEFAWGYLKMGQLEQARRYASQQIRANSRDASPYELLGYIAINAKEYQDAIFLFNVATQLAPQHHIAQYNLALSLNKTEQFTKSLEAIESALNISVLPEYLFFKGQTLEQVGKIQYAISSYENLIKMAKPTHEWQLYSSKAQERLDNLKH